MFNLQQKYFVSIATLVFLICQPSPGAVLRVPQDHKTIQAALNAAESGDTVLVSPGVYKERVRLKRGVTLKSAGDDNKGKLGLKRAEITIIDGGGKAGKRPGVVMAEQATLDGFTVTNVGLYDDAEWQKHHATQGEELRDEQGAVGTGTGMPAVSCMGVNCTIRYNIVHHNGHAGIGIRGVKGKRISPHVFRNVVYRNMGGGIGSSNGSNATIEENIGFQNLRAAIGSRNASPLVLNNICYENVRAGIGNREGAKPTLRGNKCYRNRRAGIGIRMKGTSPIVENNECYENDMAGIGNRDGATPIIRNNRCYKNKMAGIGSRDGAQALIENNECFENEMAGIGSRRGAAPIIRHNRCYRNLMAGIGAREKAKPIIIDNECFENKMAGIGSRTDAAPIIRSNRCYKNEMAGIGSRLGARPIIADNKCYENKMAGIGSRDGAAPIIRNNHCYKNEMAGIGSRSGARPVIADNESTLNRMAGIGVRGKETVALIVGNRCIENRLVAVGLPDGAAAFIHGNKLKRTGGAPPLVAAKGGSTAVLSHNSLSGGGVAALLVQGDVRVIGNRFRGKGTGQGSAVWVWNNSKVTVCDNRFDGYRNAVNAGGSAVTATDNIVRRFQGTAIIVRKSTVPGRVFGNTAVSKNPKDKAVSIDGSNGALENLLKTPDKMGKPREQTPAVWPLHSQKSNGASYHPYANTGRQVVIREGDWKLVATYGKTTTYKLFNVVADPQEKSDLSSRLEHIAYRLRGSLERREAENYKAEVRGTRE